MLLAQVGSIDCVLNIHFRLALQRIHVFIFAHGEITIFGDMAIRNSPYMYCQHEYSSNLCLEEMGAPLLNGWSLRDLTPGAKYRRGAC